MIDIGKYESLNLSQDDIGIIFGFVNHLNTFAQLTRSDIFIDCFVDEDTGIVVAHGYPKEGSLYKKNIEGAEVQKKNEPMVFYTRDTGIPMRDAEATTQENRAVLQRTFPIRNNDGNVIAVIILETDVTEEIQTRTKLNVIKEVSMELQNEDEGIVSKDVQRLDTNSIMIREIHHRIKNNLQMISSILSLQSRRTTDENVKEILRENIRRINSLATMYEFMMKEHGDTVDVFPTIQRLVQNVSDVVKNDMFKLDLIFEGEHVMMLPEQVQALVLIVNELLQNAIKHAFTGRSEGSIKVRLFSGNFLGNLNITDDGVGYYPSEEEQSGDSSGFGLTLVKMLTEEKLGGTISIENTGSGTSVNVTFQNRIKYLHLKSREGYRSEAPKEME